MFEGLLATLPGELLRALESEFRRGWHMERVQAELAARDVAAKTGDRKSIEDFGRMRLRIPASSFHYWGQREGYDCWNDKGFLREYERDNPVVRVNSSGTRTQVGYTGENRRVVKKFS